MPIKGTVSLGLTTLKNADNDYLSGINLSSDMRIGEESGLYGKIGGSVGGVSQVRASVGNVWDLNDKFNVNGSVNFERSTSVKKVQDYVNKYNDTRVFAETDLEYRSKHLNLSAGIRAGEKFSENTSFSKKTIFTGVINAGVHFGKMNAGVCYAGDAGEIRVGLTF